jgi:hypothetical protein
MSQAEDESNSQSQEPILVCITCKSKLNVRDNHRCQGRERDDNVIITVGVGEPLTIPVKN